MIKISACMIVRDGAGTLGKALSSLNGYVDEIVVGIDSRTVDKSETIARQFKANTFRFDWIGDFSYARNIVAARAKYDTILVLDADDSLESGKQDIFRDAAARGDGCRFIIKTSGTTQVTFIRCYNRKTARYIYKVHEILQFDDSERAPVVIDVPITITHEKDKIIEPGRNKKILDQALSEYPRYLFYHGRECLNLCMPQDAIKSFRLYLQIGTWEPERLEAMIGIARAYVMLDDIPAGKRAVYDILAENQNFMPAYNLLGQIYQHEQDYQTAIRFYNHCLHCQPIMYLLDDSAAVRLNTYGNLIVCYSKIGDMAGALMAAVHAEAIEPGNSWITKQVEGIKE